MVQPIDYSIANAPDPSAQFLQGIQGGLALNQAQMQLQQQQMAMQQQLQMHRDLTALATNPNSTGSDYARVMTMYPAISEHLKRAADTLNDDQQQSALTQSSQVFAALRSGRNDVAQQLLEQHATALGNSGQAQQAQLARAQAQLAQTDPAALQAGLVPIIGALKGGDKVLTGVGTMGQEGRAAALAPYEVATKKAEAGIKGAEASVAPQRQQADLSNVLSQIGERSARLALDRDRLTSETQTKMMELQQKFGELPDSVAAGVNTAATDSVASQQSANRMIGLASQIDSAAGALGSGVSAKAGELWKRTFGDQNELTRIRSEYSQIVTRAAMAAYKQVASGSTSDKDIDTAMVGVPPDTASPERMASFLRGAAKLQVYDSVLADAKSQWLGTVRSLNKAPRDIEVDGVRVPAGTTYKQFVDRYVATKAEKQIDSISVRGRSYWRFDPAGAQGAAAPAAEAAPSYTAPGTD